ncbi:OprD family porin [Pseudomonas sp. CC120222-01a]|uniref:OprD family porin n=1 Tax=Pseudomonas sp. CC120222-01a TaxID=1378075 RepID=UPI000DA055CA|nr:OprD family porin [Pseudomonas sp. CC120222-01a]PVZ36935.1 imipenem/basic amino acid-specific outer membrane pore [Pseudomonas sp. CC120222-01a]
MHVVTQGVTALAVSLACAMAQASEQSESEGFVEGSSLRLLNRNFYFNRDFRDAAPGDQSYREEWAHGIMAFYESGFTQGSVGFGVDAFGLQGLKLDSGRGRSGAGLLPVDSDDRPEDDYSSAGAAVKVRVSNTELRYGNMRTEAPVFATGDSRLLPETATGLLLQSKEIEDLDLQAGHFTAYKLRNSSNQDEDLYLNYGEGRIGRSIDFVGGTYALSKQLSASLYASDFEETWHQYYGNLNYTLPLTDTQALDFDANLYKTRDTGKALQGEIDNTTYSLALGYTFGAHKLTLAHQHVDGNTPFDFVGGDSIFLANSVNYSDFNGANERSWQVRYDLDFASYGVPGLKFSARYLKGDHIDGSKADPLGGYAGLQGEDGKHWERNFDLRYVVQSGAAKDLSLRLRHTTHRANEAQAEGDVDEVRVIVEYPLELF